MKFHSFFKIMRLFSVVGLGIGVPASAASKCIIFVHGHHRYVDYARVEKYWVGTNTYYVGIEDRGLDFGNGIAAATNENYHYSYVVGYDATQAYPVAAADVAHQIKAAMLGLPDEGMRRYCPTMVDGKPMQYVVVAHSMGGVVMDFILGNATPTSPNYNFMDAPFNEVAEKLDFAIAIGSPHAGTRTADVIMGSTGNALLTRLHAVLPVRERDQAIEWLQTSQNYQVYRQMTHPRKEIRLYAGIEKLISSLVLFGDDDGVVSVASAFACGGDPNARRRLEVRSLGSPYFDLPVCEDSPGGHIGGFQNFSNHNAGYENHGDLRRNVVRKARLVKGLPGGKRCLERGSVLEEVACGLGE